jgi:uncharacterized protein
MKKQPSHDPRRLDVEVFARDAAALNGRLLMREMPRFTSLLHETAADDGAVWRIEGSLAAPAGSRPEPRLHLTASATVKLQCQRCLEPLAVHVEVDRLFRFLPDETAAGALDAECEDEVLVTSRALDVLELVEDELLLALPLVPRHEQCPVDLIARVREEPSGRQRPFETLGTLKKQ